MKKKKEKKLVGTNIIYYIITVRHSMFSVLGGSVGRERIFGRVKVFGNAIRAHWRADGREAMQARARVRRYLYFFWQ